MTIHPLTVVGIESDRYGNYHWTYEDYVKARPDQRVRVFLNEEYRHIEKELDPGPMITMSKAQYDHDLYMARLQGRIEG